MLSNLAASLIVHGRIQTTVKRAKVLRPFVEKIVTRCRRCASSTDYGSRDHHYRLVHAELRNEWATAVATRVWGPYFLVRPGGYTRIMRNGHRAGDGAEMAVIEFVLDHGSDATHAEIVRSLAQYVPSGIQYRDAWRALPRPITELVVDNSALRAGRVGFDLSVALADIAQNRPDWPRCAGSMLPMELTLSVSMPKSATILKLVADPPGAGPSERMARLRMQLDPERRRSRVRGELSFEGIAPESRYCTISVDGPAGEIFHAALLGGDTK